MSNYKIAILGAGNIGKFHVREFKNSGNDVAAILGSTIESTKKLLKSCIECLVSKLNNILI